MRRSFSDATFVDVVRDHVARQPHAPAFTWLRDGESDAVTLSYCELDQRARQVAAMLVGNGLAGQPVLLLYPTGLDYIVALFGCFYAGAIAVPAYPPTRTSMARTLPRIVSIAKDAGARAALTSLSVQSTCEAVAAFNQLRFLATDAIEAQETSHATLPTIQLETPCVLQYTSGSTGIPKGVFVRQRQLIENQRLLSATSPFKGTWVTWLPPYHDMGLMGGILHPPFIGAHSIILSPESFIRRPLRWLRAVSKYKAETTLAPNFAFDLCVRRIAQDDREGLDLSSLRVAYNGAEPINPRTLEAFTAAFAAHGFRRETFHPCYGMAETTLVISGGNAEAAPVYRDYDIDALNIKRAVPVRMPSSASRRLVGCGRALLDSKVIAVDPDTCEELSERHIGELWVDSPSIADGYWNRPEESEATFRARLSNGQGPFLRTGDLGFLDGGEIFVTGRLKDLIIIRGRNHFPHDIERTIQGVDAALIEDSGAAFSVDVAGEERLVIVQELDHRLGADVQSLPARISSAVRDAHDLSVHALVLVKKGSSLKTSSGKIQRRALRQAFLDGHLQEVLRFPGLATAREELESPRAARADETHTRLISAAFDESKLLRLICEQVAEKTGVETSQIDMDSPLAQYGVDSLIAAELSEKLEVILQRKLSTTLTYDHPTVRALARALCQRDDVPDARPVPEARVPPPTRLRASVEDDPVVIVGMGCRFPGASDLRAFWSLLRNGVDAITEIPEDRFSLEGLYDADRSTPGKLSSRFGGFVEAIDGFDPAFFGISEREAARMDPQQRLFLEVAWEALEDACIAPTSLAGTDTSVFAGVCGSDYTLLFNGKLDLVDADYGTGNAASIVANRLSYFLNLRGPSMALDAACSSSLVALQTACHSLARGETNLAIVGGVNAVLAPEPAVFFSKARALAADGRCKAFDIRADGFVRSEGCGVVVLKRMSQAVRDRDRIYAVIAGGAINQDGMSNGLMAPSLSAQESLLRKALDNAQITAADIDYVEAHGVGAKLADAVELRALGAVQNGRDPQHPCWVGSVKTNIGHLEAASGMASVIKTALALTHEEIPPHLHLQDVHPDIGIEHLPLSIPTIAQKWSRGERARFAGVSTFGFGGTNAHVILREAPSVPRSAPQPDRSSHVLALSARNPAALQQLAARFAHQTSRLPLADVCYSANVGRAHFKERKAFVARDQDALQAALRSFLDAGVTPSTPSTQRKSNLRIGIALGDSLIMPAALRQLYRTAPRFRQALDHTGHLLADEIECSLTELLFSGHDAASPDLRIPARYRPACIVAIHYALYSLLSGWGIKPSAVLAQGVSEYSAAAISGVLAWEDAIMLAAKHGALLESMKAGAPQLTTLERFRRALDTAPHHSAKLKWFAASLSRTIGPDEALSSSLFSQHVFHEHTERAGLEAFIGEELDVRLQLDGTHFDHPELQPETWLAPFDTSEHAADPTHSLLSALATLYERGADIDWQAFDAPHVRQKRALPTYPFQRKRLWLDFPQRSSAPSTTQAAPTSTVRTVSGHPLLQRVIQSTASQSGFQSKVPKREVG